MSAPASLAEALAQCRANGVDTRVSGKGLSACMDLMAPFCDGNISSSGPNGLPSCLPVEQVSARKAALLLAETQARQQALRDAASGPSLVVLGLGGAALLGLVVYAATR